MGFPWRGLTTMTPVRVHDALRNALGGTGRFCGEGKMMGQRSLLLTDLLHGSLLTAFSLSSLEV